jgi:hypothetical protein
MGTGGQGGGCAAPKPVGGLQCGGGSAATTGGTFQCVSLCTDSQNNKYDVECTETNGKATCECKYNGNTACTCQMQQAMCSKSCCPSQWQEGSSTTSTTSTSVVTVGTTSGGG